ncbi:MAG: hypothetical protein ACRC7V_01360 [Lachnospiraceae bacterium]
MLTVLLQILNFIFCFFLISLVVLCVVIGVLLFIPICYKITFHKMNEFLLKGRVHILFPILSMVFSYDTLFSYKIYLFGIPIHNSQKEKKEKKIKKVRRKKHSEKSTQKQKEIKNESIQAQKIVEQDLKAEIKEDKKREKKEKSNIKKFILDIVIIIKSILKKFTSIKEGIVYFLDYTKKPHVVKAFLQCKNRLVKILKSYLPRKWKVQILVGSKEPDIVGGILSIYGMCYPWIYDHIIITPDFSKDVFEMEGFAKGKVRVFVIVKHFIALYFDKNIKKLLYELKNEF